jgi:hypothetical protein
METCQGGVYYEMSGCTFDSARDYSCYAIPMAPNPFCPAGLTPIASQACDVPQCSACNSQQGLVGGAYLDSTGAAKVGFCVCQAPSAAGTRTWSCASDTAWPCPGPGCETGGTGGGGTGGSFGWPSCIGLVTAAGMEPARGVSCAPGDPQLCYRTCGPEQSGVKAEQCTTAWAYQEMSGCSFDPTRDYSCYRIPSVVNAACPTGVLPQASAACNVPTCTPCNSTQGLPGGGYLDSTGASRIGFCVCQPPNAAGVRTWSCATDTQWPCPLQTGC